MAKVKVTCTYEYGGDMETNQEAIDEEKKALVEGAVSIADIMAAGDATLEVEIIGDVSDEDDTSEDEDDEDDEEEDEEEKAA